MRLKGKYRPDGTYVYANNLLFRYACIFFVLILGIGFIGSLREAGWDNSYIFPLVILLFGLCGALYVETWTFSPSKRTITASFGVWPVIQRKTIPVEDVERVVVKHFRRGTLETGPDAPKRRWGNKPMVTLSLETRQGKMDIEIIPERVSGGTTEQVGRIIAGLFGLPFDMDRPYDGDTKTTLRDI